MITLSIGLAGNLMNEVLHGFRVPTSEEETLANCCDRMEQILSDANAYSHAKQNLEQEIVFDGHDEVIMRWALRLTLDDLGMEEFAERTGYDFELGKALLETAH